MYIEELKEGDGDGVVVTVSNTRGHLHTLVVGILLVLDTIVGDMLVRRLLLRRSILLELVLYSGT